YGFDARSGRRPLSEGRLSSGYGYGAASWLGARRDGKPVTKPVEKAFNTISGIEGIRLPSIGGGIRAESGGLAVLNMNGESSHRLWRLGGRLIRVPCCVAIVLVVV